MSRDSALREAQQLKAALLDHGVPRVSIELQQGRPVAAGDRWDSLRVVGNFAHHTVSRYKTSNLTPCLALCKKGRSDVPGPLCNGYGGYDLTYRIITLGLANHPGRGGPYTVDGFRIPADSARPYTWGTEWEGGLEEADWDRPLTVPGGTARMTMREFMGRAHAGIADHFDLPLSAHLEHSTWAPRRKIDRLGYSHDEGIAETRRYATPAPRASRTATRKPLPRPVVDLSDLVAAARRDPRARQGTTTHRDDVLVVERALATQRLLDKRWIDGSFGTKTVTAYAAWQRRLGYTGRDADGIPGSKSLTELGRRAGFTVRK